MPHGIHVFRDLEMENMSTVNVFIWCEQEVSTLEYNSSTGILHIKLTRRSRHFKGKKTRRKDTLAESYHRCRCRRATADKEAIKKRRLKTTCQVLTWCRLLVKKNPVPLRVDIGSLPENEKPMQYLMFPTSFLFYFIS